jgi:hypothetical protein
MTAARIVATIVAHRVAASLGGAALAAAIALGGFKFCRRQDNPIPPSEAFSLDSLKATKPAFNSTQRAASRRADSTVAKIVIDSAPIAAARREADRWRRTADSLATLARARDSIAALARDSVESSIRVEPVDSTWKMAAAAYKHDADSLRVVDRRQAADLSSATVTIRDLHIALADANARVAASEAPKTGLNERLTRDVQRASECSILGVFRCPPRKVVYLGGVVTTVAVGAAIRYRKQLGIP